MTVTTQPTTRSRYEVLIAESRERFIRDTAKHEMTVLHDDGLYRHLRFAEPGTSSYYYSLVTWPGYLAIVGDGPDYVFCRLPDMFEFFAGSCSAGARGEINPGYWAEKLRGPGRDVARTYSYDVLRARAEHVGVSGDMTRDGAVALREALDRDVLDENLAEVHDEHDAHGLLRAFEHHFYSEPDGCVVVQRIADSWEWDLREYDTWFLWACWAIVRGIEQYRTAARETGGDGS